MIDQYGIYVQHNGDSGDSSHRSGLVMAIKGLFNDPDVENIYKISLQFEVDDGIYVRHPFADNWHKDPTAFSRDQASRLMLGYAVLGKKDKLKSWFKKMLSRGLMHQNNQDPTTGEKKLRDIMAPGEFRNLIRGLDLWYLYPVLLVLDTLFIGDIYTRSTWDGSSLYVPDLKYAKKKYPTPVAYFADWLNNKTPWLEEALHNHSVEKNGCVELQELFIRLNEL